jgi:hypothetical protein
MSKSKLTGRQAFANMKYKMDHHISGVQGYCQKICHEAWGLPGGQPDAISAWNAVPKAARHTDASKAPIGAPHFWAGGAHGHVALQSDRKGVVISTDAPVADHVGEVSVDWFHQHWGKTYLGWASNYMGTDLQLSDLPK